MLKVRSQLTVVNPLRPFRAPGEETDECFHVVSGAIATFRPLPGSGQRIVAVAYPGDTILPARSPNTGLAALVASEVEPIARPCNGEAAAIARLNERIALEWLARDALDAASRLAHLLCEITVRGGYERDKVPLFTQQQLGEITGQTSVNTNRVLAEFERSGLIARPKPRMVKIRDWDTLARMSGFRPEYLTAAY